MTKRNVLIWGRTVIISLAGVILVGLATYFVWTKNPSAIDPDNFTSVRLAILDGEKLKATAKCFGAHETVAKMFTDVLSKMRGLENQMKADYERVKRSAKLSPKQKTKEISKIETKWGAISAQYNAQIQEIRNLEQNLTEEIQLCLMSVIEKIARDAKLSAVVNKGNKDLITVFYASPVIDITNYVIKKLDEVLPSIDINQLKKHHDR